MIVLIIRILDLFRVFHPRRISLRLKRLDFSICLEGGKNA